MSETKETNKNVNAPATPAAAGDKDLMKKIIAGVLILAAFWCVFFSGWSIWIGYVLVAVAAGFLWKKTEVIGPKPKDLKVTEWKTVNKDVIEKAASKFENVKKAKKGKIGCWIIIPIAIVAFLIAVWAVPKDNNTAKALSTDSTVVVQSDDQEVEKLIPHGWNKKGSSSEKSDSDDFAEKSLFFVISICLIAYAVFCTGGVEYFKPDKLLLAMEQQQGLNDKEGSDWYTEKTLEVAKVANVPLNMKTVFKNKTINPNFLGIQVQTQTNKGPNGQCPYTYCVILAKKDYDLIGKYNAVKKDLKAIVGNYVLSDETKNSKDVSVLVLRKNGYETNKGEVNKTVDMAEKVMELIDAGKTEF